MKQHMTTLVYRGIAMNFMNAFPKICFFFVCVDVCSGFDRNMTYMIDLIAFIY